MIAVSSTFTDEPLAESLHFWNNALQLNESIAFAPYNVLQQQLIDPNSLLRKNSNGTNVLLTRIEDWARFNKESTDQLSNIRAYLSQLIEAISTATKQTQAIWLIYLCPPSESWIQLPENKSLSEEIERTLIDVSNQESIVFLSPNLLLQQYSTIEYNNPHGNMVGHIPYSDDFFAVLGTRIIRSVYSSKCPPCKAVIVDCDNTLWSGICGESEINTLQIKPYHLKFQQRLLDLRNSGTLITLCSKNNAEDVWAVFDKRSDMLLKREHITTARINWEPKSTNLKDIARELNIGLDSMVFIDDSPIEISETQAHAPEAISIRFPTNPEEFEFFNQNLWALDERKSTNEDLQRSKMYREEANRNKIKNSDDSIQTFLEKLDLKVEIENAAPEDFPRLSQLTYRTNQFNTTTLRLSETELKNRISAGTICLKAHVKDKFGDYGTVGTILLSLKPDHLAIDALMLSCRALGRGVEHKIIAHIGELALQNELKQIKIAFQVSEKNKPAELFLQSISELQPNDLFPFSISATTAINLKPSTLTTSSNEDVRSTSEPSLETNGKHRSLWLSLLASELHSSTSLLQSIRQQKKTRPNLTEAFELPNGTLEETIAAIFSDVLRIDTIGVNDNFYDLGGRSLQLVKVHLLLTRHINRDFPITILFQHPTVRSLRTELERKKNESNDLKKALTRAKKQRMAFKRISKPKFK